MKSNPYWVILTVVLSSLLPLVMMFYLAAPPTALLLPLTSLLFCVVLFVLYKRGARSFFQIILVYLLMNGWVLKATDVLRSGVTSFNFYYNFRAFEEIKEREKENPALQLFRVVTFGLPQGIAIYHGLQAADMEHNYYPITYFYFWLKVLNDGDGIDLEEYQSFLNGDSYHNVILRMPKSDESKFHVKDLFFNIDLLALMNVKYLVSRAVIESPERYHLEPIWEEAMVSCRSFGFDLEGFKCRIKKYLQGPKASLYRLTQTVDRFFIVNQVRIFDTAEALYESLRTSPLTELKTHLYITREAESMLDPTPPIASPSPEMPEELGSKIESIDYTPDRINLSAFSTEPSYLVMTEIYSSRWKCYDNGTRTPIIPAYGTFRAIRLIPGHHDISCRFEKGIAF